MPEVLEVPGKPDPLYPTMELLMKLAKQIAPAGAVLGLQKKAEELQAEAASKHRGFKAEAAFMRVLQNGVDFGKWA